MTDCTGTIEAIFVYPHPMAMPVRLAEATAEAGAGLKEDRARVADRQVTVLSREDWERAGKELGRQLPPETRRANVVVAGVPLAGTIGLRLRVGEAVVRVCGETVPCGRMDEAAAGLRACLEPDGRGGVFGVVEIGGRLAVGDAVRVLDAG